MGQGVRHAADYDQGLGASGRADNQANRKTEPQVHQPGDQRDSLQDAETIDEEMWK